MKTRLPLHRKWNTDRIAVTEEVIQQCQKAGIEISFSDAEYIIEEYEAILLRNLCGKRSVDFKWELPHCFIATNISNL